MMFYFYWLFIYFKELLLSSLYYYEYSFSLFWFYAEWKKGILCLIYKQFFFDISRKFEKFVFQKIQPINISFSREYIFWRTFCFLVNSTYKLVFFSSFYKVHCPRGLFIVYMPNHFVIYYSYLHYGHCL